jgi:hypothetical protein
LKVCDIGGFNSDNFDVPLIIQEFQNVGIEFPDWDDFIDVLKVERIINSNKLGEVFKDTPVKHWKARTTLEHKGDKIFALNKLKDIFAEIEGFEGELTPKIIDRLSRGSKAF